MNLINKIKKLYDWNNVEINQHEGYLYINCFFNDIYTDIAYNEHSEEYTIVWYNDVKMLGNMTVKNKDLITTLKQIYES